MERFGDTLLNKRSGFTLAEVLAALVIGSMVLVVTLAIYARAESSTRGVMAKLDSQRVPSEILQRIAEDLDGIIAADQDTKITIDNKFQEGFSVARMEIVRTIYDEKNQPQILEKIVWQSGLDPDVGMLVLYRSHSGVAMEDKLLDEEKEVWQREVFVPICSGFTFFKIEVPDGNNLADKWTGQSLPSGVVVSISFGQPYKTVTGELDVPEEEKVTRTIAIDRTRKIKFTLGEPAGEANDINDVNTVDVDKQKPKKEPNEPNVPPVQPPKPRIRRPR
jgi:prepilin-type N-terminal cleavage/methylation domain-containing protein